MSKESCTPHTVGVLVTEGTNPFEMGVATEVFGLDRPEMPGRPYHLDTCGPGELEMRDGFFTLRPSAPLEALVDMDTVIVPGHPTPWTAADPQVLSTLHSAHAAGARMVSFCSGSLLLAEAGLLDGRVATTHWRYAQTFEERFPDVELRRDVLYVEDPPIFTAAGSAAALDLALHLVRLDNGEEAANIVSRRLVFPAHRPGDQRQFVDPPTVGLTDVPSVDGLQRYVAERLADPITVAELAAHAHMSVSGFHRWFKDAVGATPQQWVIQQRLACARRLLESTDATVEEVSAVTGFGTSTNMRQHFKRAVGTTPTAYRSAFSRG